MPRHGAGWLPRCAEEVAPGAGHKISKPRWTAAFFGSDMALKCIESNVKKCFKKNIKKHQSSHFQTK